MKSITRLADMYEVWAAQDESNAAMMLATKCFSDVRCIEWRREEADRLRQQAAQLRHEAAELRRSSSALAEFPGTASPCPPVASA
jgi:hypothetical protein